MKKIFKKLIIKSTAILCSAMLLFMSPYAGYLGANKMEYVQAVELAVAEGGIEIIEIIIAILSLATGTVVYANHEAIENSFTHYLESPKHIDVSMTDICMQVYNSNTNTITDISWQGVLESLHEFHDEAVDDLTGIYVKYCPQLLDICYDFAEDVLDGDIYVEGISDAIVEYANITEEDIEKQRSGELFQYGAYTGVLTGINSGIFNYQDYYRYAKFTDDGKTPIAGCRTSYPFSSGDIMYCIELYYPLGYGIHTRAVTWECYYVSPQGFEAEGIQRFTSYRRYSHAPITISCNFPLFASVQEVENYLKTGEGYENALNYGLSVYDDIESTAELPPFHKEWIQELLNKINNTPGGLGIGSYGHGISAENWMDSLTWIKLQSLLEYSSSLDGIYRQMIEDIINGTYDSADGTPGTYSEAWEQTISEAWDSIVEQSTDAMPGESEKNKPTDGDDDDKDDPEGSGDSNNNQEEPPKGGDNNDNTGNPSISKSALDHATKQHMPSKYALQLGYLSREAVEAALEDLSFFNVNWTEEQVIEALTLGYEEALSNGYVSGKYTFTYLGETIIIALSNGVFKTGFGLHSYTYDELYELFLLLGGE